MKPRVSRIEWQNLKTLPAYQGLAILTLIKKNRIPVTRVGFVEIDGEQHYLCLAKYKNGGLVTLWKDEVANLRLIYRRFFPKNRHLTI